MMTMGVCLKFATYRSSIFSPTRSLSLNGEDATERSVLVVAGDAVVPSRLVGVSSPRALFIPITNKGLTMLDQATGRKKGTYT
jgi:hypothetical protein